MVLIEDRWRWIWAAAWCGLLLPLAGCATKPAEINGKVSYADEPVVEGTIQFEPVDRKSSSFGAAISNGQYRANLPSNLVEPSMYLVRIESWRKTGKQVHSGPPFDDSALVDETVQYLPAIYNSASTLTREITADALQQVDFELPRQK
jgi:hypothetical protein